MSQLEYRRVYKNTTNKQLWGKIQQYGLQQTDLASNTTTSQTRTYSYGSLNEGQTTFAPNSINYTDGTNVNEQYGIGGSLQRRETNIPGSQPETEHYRFTANGNLQAYMYENLLYVHYGYDGGTTRTYKYSFDLNPNWVNGHLESVNFNPHTAMFYPNSYLNFNSNGYYTKHYYNGMERIASRLGDQNLPINVNDPDLQDRKDQLDSNIRRNIVDITGYEFLEPGQEQDPDDPKPVFELPQVGMTNLISNTSSVYYYHTNHLGSTCYVTDGNSNVVQGFLYAPFGEITNEYNVGWQNGNIPKYAFNAKELDEETGFYYYEARYYNPPTFISRDPLFEKYPTFSPYAYCANNPVKYVDPTGMDLDIADNEETKNDLLSLVSDENIGRIEFKEGIHVSVNTVGLSKDEIENDIGLSLINNMCNSDKKFLFETSDVALICNTNGEPDAVPLNKVTGEIVHGVINASNYGLDSKDTYTYRPKKGYDGQVVIALSGRWFDDNENKNKKSLIFHELAENYYRTHHKKNYNVNGSNMVLGSAHYSAVLLEGDYYGNPNPGGINRYIGFKITEQIYKKYEAQAKQYCGFLIN